MSFFNNVLKILKEYMPLFLEGIKNTMLIAIIGTVIGFLIGLFVAIIRTIPIEKNDSAFKKVVLTAVRWILVAYIEQIGLFYI